MRKTEFLHKAVAVDLLKYVGPVLLVDESDAAELFDRGVALQVVVPLDALLRIVPRVDDFLKADGCGEIQFRFEHRDYPLCSNEARRIGLELATTPYVVLTDNDALVHDGWL